MLTQFTTIDGIVTIETHGDELTIRFRADDGKHQSITMPAFKFAWAAQDFVAVFKR
jgi:hypothetical protein